MKSRVYPTDLSDVQWDLVRPLLVDDPHKRGRKYGGDMRLLVDALFYMAHTGCQWRYLPTPFPDWTQVWSQFRRWSRNDTLARVLVELHGQARMQLGSAERAPSLLILDSSLARGASNGGPTFHDRGGPYGNTKGAKRVIAVDTTGLPLGGLVVPASTTEVRGQVLLLEQLADLGALDRLEKVMVDRGTQPGPAAKMAATFGMDVEVIGWDDHQPEFRPIPRAWRVEVSHGKLGRSRRLSKSFEKTDTSGTAWLQLACLATVLDVWNARTSRAKTQKEVDSAAAHVKTRPGRVYKFADRNDKARAS